MPSDSVDSILAQWKQARPDLNCSSMGVVGRLRRTSNLWKSKMDCVFKQHGLSSIEFDILATIRRSDAHGITPTELYKTLMLSSGAVSTRIEHMVKQELVERVFSEHDRRSCRVILTNKGIELVDNALNDHVTNMNNMLSALNPDEQDQLANLLRKVLLSETDNN
ncbi:MarR family winged helix-turn-helix transcriptional regulator [Vibrio europaeus]|uniref:MarR family winged helix-turn-helix transcriptional regulator n=1 Tax=Vibrio europaeus TaxID=300876 RepID=UPI00233F1EA7|nr:MarR family winged helix-turn-helix transcriptional regulator [Vibrio europaeus]MDC5856769.1 MarR family winged helix-turn-helix transcriptional regulator [Vibrio europaeus]